MTPNDALSRLMGGTSGIKKGVSKRHDVLAKREALVGGQNPNAGILSCADSRTAPIRLSWMKGKSV